MFLIIIQIYHGSVDEESILWIGLFTVFGLIYWATGSDWKTTFNNVSSMMMFPVAIILLKKLNQQRILSLMIIFIKWTMVIFSLECIIRFCWSTIAPSAAGIYRYKFHSILFQDTNFLGLALLVVIFSIKYLKIFFDVKQLNKWYIIAIFLLLFSISRAAIMGWIIGECIFHKINNKNFSRKILSRILIIASIIIIIWTSLYNILNEDPSFKSKLYILDLAQNVSSYYENSILWGLGYGKSEESLGIFPHNLLLLYILEIGIIGLALKIIFLYIILLKSHFICLILMVPYFIATMSATGYATHYFYLMCALIVLSFNKNFKNENICTYTYLQC